ncbi:MAG: bifunctional phosphoribosylaminoimidazolecarboxamide formyltransferase/IMP cyclohydrolase [Terriglobia bacterium]
MKVKRALVSVSDKRGLIGFVKGLSGLGIEIISTGGTARSLDDAGVTVTKVSDVTRFPEMLGGRVKTLHPAIHGAILAKRTKDHLVQLKDQDIEPIDLIVVNLYPFYETISKNNVTLDDAVEQIDIGGPAMVRAAAKNFEGVGIVTDPSTYGPVLDEIKDKGFLSRATRMELARDAFRMTAEYDATIYHYLEEEKDFPPFKKLIFEKIGDLRYGENPHQRAAFYGERFARPNSLVSAKQLSGKDLSYNNILDLDAAWRLVKEFEEPAAIIVKHNNPCGAAEAGSLLKAYQAAFACDPVSAFGGILAFNREVDRGLASEIRKTFIEAIVAPGFSAEALEELAQKKDMRLLDVGAVPDPGGSRKELRTVDGGVLVQDRDEGREVRKGWETATAKEPTAKELNDLLFAWKVAKHVKSNTIVYARDGATLGVGAGQMSRIDAAELGVMKAVKSELSVDGSVLASDAFFPFPDVAEFAAGKGIKAIVQPGGSIRDKEIIKACDDHGVAMVLTGVRHFRH